MDAVDKLVSLREARVMQPESLARGFMRTLDALAKSLKKREYTRTMAFLHHPDAPTEEDVKEFLQIAHEISEARSKLQEHIDMMLSDSRIQKELKVDTTGLMMRIAVIIANGA